MIHSRAYALLATVTLMTSLVAPRALAAAPDAQQWRFRAYLDDAPVGFHRIAVQRHGASWIVESEARFDVMVMTVPVYRYHHRASERWTDGCLTALSAHSEENGRTRDVQAIAEGDQLAVTSPRGEMSLGGCVMSYAYWNPAMLHATEILNAQTGEYTRVRVTRLADATSTVRGKSLRVQRWRVDTPRHAIDLTYTPDGQWVGLETTVVMGKRLQYRLE